MAGLRVAVDVTPLLGMRTGVAQCVAHLLAALPEAAPEVEVVPYALSRRARTMPDLLKGTRVLPVPASVAIRAWGWSDRPSVARHFDDVDVVHGTNFVVPPTHRPSTVTVHDTYCLVHPRACDPAVRPFDRVLRRAVSRGTWVHASTRSVASQVLALYGAERVSVVPFGIPAIGPAGSLPTELEGRRYILAINTLEPRKRHEHLVRAFRSVAPWDPELLLVIAGADGSATEAVDRAIRALPHDVAARVVRVSEVSQSMRSTLLRRATVLAYPSADEGFGFPVLEGMAAGVPVVATRAGALPEVAGDAALLVPVEDDPGVLVDALRRVIVDGSLRDDLRRRGLARAGTFSWDRHALGMVDMWRAAAEAG